MPNADFDETVSELMTRAQLEHPSVLEAQAQLRALEAKVEQTRAEGLPSISVVAKSNHNNQPVSPSIGQPQYPASGRDWSVAVQVNIPIFEGFARTYQVRQTQAQVELQGVALDQGTQPSRIGCLDKLSGASNFHSQRCQQRAVARACACLSAGFAGSLHGRRREHSRIAEWCRPPWPPPSVSVYKP